MLETNRSRSEKQKVGLSAPRLVWELKVCISGTQLVQVPHYSVILRLTQGAAVASAEGPLANFPEPIFFKGNFHFIRGRLKWLKPLPTSPGMKMMMYTKGWYHKTKLKQSVLPCLARRPWTCRVVEELWTMCNGWPGPSEDAWKQG